MARGGIKTSSTPAPVEQRAEALARSMAIRGRARELAQASITRMIAGSESRDIYERYGAVKVMGNVAADSGHRWSAMAQDALSRVATDRSGFAGVQIAALTELVDARSKLAVPIATKMVARASLPVQSRVAGAQALGNCAPQWDDKTPETLTKVALTGGAIEVRLAALSALNQPNVGLAFEAVEIEQFVTKNVFFNADDAFQAARHVISGVIGYAANNPDQHHVLNGIIDAFYNGTTANEVGGAVFPPENLSLAIGLALEQYPHGLEAFSRALEGRDKTTPGYRGLMKELQGKNLGVQRALAYAQQIA
jgi:hypothetical protein